MRAPAAKLQGCLFVAGSMEAGSVQARVHVFLSRSCKLPSAVCMGQWRCAQARAKRDFMPCHTDMFQAMSSCVEARR